RLSMTKVKEGSQTISIKVSREVYALLEVLDEPKDVIMELIDHAQKGVYRPGAWERNWVCQAFGDDWIERLVETGDPYGRPEKRTTPGLEYFYCPDCQRTHDAQREAIPQGCIQGPASTWSIRTQVRNILRDVRNVNGSLRHANSCHLDLLGQP